MFVISQLLFRSSKGFTLTFFKCEDLYIECLLFWPKNTYQCHTNNDQYSHTFPSKS